MAGNDAESLQVLVEGYQELKVAYQETRNSFSEIMRAAAETAKNEGWVTFWPYLAVPTAEGERYINVPGGCLGANIYRTEAIARESLRKMGLTVRRRDGAIMAMVNGIPRDTESKIVSLRDTFRCPLAENYQGKCLAPLKEEMDKMWNQAWHILRPRIPKEHCVLIVSVSDKPGWRQLTFAEYVSHILEGNLPANAPIEQSGEGSYVPDGYRPGRPD
jgi:hypothetical protein